MKNRVCVKYKKIAEPEMARKSAENEARKVIDILRYAIPALYKESERVAIGLQGESPLNTRHVVIAPNHKESFNIYMDNYVTSIILFKYLREEKIGACGIVRKNSARFPQILKIDKKLNWDTLSGVVVDNVLAILWMNNGPVTMLSTIHQIDGNENRIERIRR